MTSCSYVTIKSIESSISIYISNNWSTHGKLKEVLEVLKVDCRGRMTQQFLNALELFSS